MFQNAEGMGAVGIDAMTYQCSQKLIGACECDSNQCCKQKPASIGTRLKQIWFDFKLDSLGVTHGVGCTYTSPVYIHAETGSITFGDNVSLNHNVTINANDGGKISIGDNVSIGMNTVIRAANHNYMGEGNIPGTITIGSNVWIGANCVILPDVTIGSGSVIGAGSIVTKNIPANVVAVGNPCKVIKQITR